MAKSLVEELKGKIWIPSWKRGDIETSWGAWGYMRKSRRSARKMGWAGLYFDTRAGHPQMVLAVGPRGGMSGCRFLLEQCRAQWKAPMVIPKEDLEHWAGWERENCIVYHIQPLTPTMLFDDDVRRPAAKAARKFFTIAMPHLQRLGGS